MGNTLVNKMALIIEPDEDILDVVTAVLVAEGMEVLGFRFFSESLLDIIKERAIGIVLIAFKLKGEDAIYALREIKRCVPIPVIAMSCDMDIVEKSIKNGFNGHIAKPFDIDELFRLVSSSIKSLTKN